eukprot:CAMPEP_0194199204 /NCGR_PEP_ID=MMETSP0156-20130528/307_1 /TAXON_ID=33649 /ORGANISM="Thalassionema nitzschioides, Strain L26-B" /LENGTH=198 /DNA_ID=CAMNT_0038924061 /DNA_START=41 /DNA_END=637 /DNA_ORIENTATION=+
MVSTAEETSEDEVKPPPFVAPLMRKQPKPTREESVEKCVEYVRAVSNMELYFDPHNRPKQCKCVWENIKCQGGEEWETCIAEVIYDFLVVKCPKARQEILFETAKVVKAQKRNAKVLVPAIGKPEGKEVFSVCVHSYYRLLNAGKQKIRTLNEQVKNNEITPSGMTGKSNRKLDPVVLEALEKTFDELTKWHRREQLG